MDYSWAANSCNTAVFGIRMIRVRSRVVDVEVEPPPERLFDERGGVDDDEIAQTALALVISRGAKVRQQDEIHVRSDFPLLQ